MVSYSELVSYTKAFFTPICSLFIILWGLCVHFFLYTCMRAKSLQSCLTLCDSMDCSPPGSSVHGILQARILEWVAAPSSRGASQPRDWTWVWCLLHWPADPLLPALLGKPCIFIYLPVLGLCCYEGFPLVSESRGHFLAAVCSLHYGGFCCRPWASVASARRLSGCSPQALEHKFNSCGTQA